MSYFIFTVYEEPRFNDCKIGTLYFVEEGDQFLETDSFTGLKVFNEEAYKEQSEGLFA